MTVSGADGKVLRPEGGYSPAWSPDGRRIAFVVRGEGDETRIHVINADGSGWMDVTDHPRYSDREPVWSPDGKRLAFVSCSVSVEGFATNDQVFVVDVPEG